MFIRDPISFRMNLSQQNPLRLIEPQNESDFQDRAAAFLRYVAAHDDSPRATQWGRYRSFDGYFLARLALNENVQQALQLLDETLDMIRKNFAEEVNGRGDKWHLADFALHPLLRALVLYQGRAPGHPAWTRLASTARSFLFHFGDLTENHNLLHLAGRYLVAAAWPDATFLDGRSAAIHARESHADLLGWIDRWVTRGSVEWGSDIYANVNFLSLLNLYDFAPDLGIRRAVMGVLDLFLVEQSLEAFAGAQVGAARRSYGAYRTDVRQSPLRPLHHLYFGTGGGYPFNLNFIGGVIQAATSRYRPARAIGRIAMNRSMCIESHSTHLEGNWAGAWSPTPFPDDKPAPADHLSKTTWRQPEAMLSVMNSYGGLGRYTEHVWQATLGEEAIIFSNHPSLSRSGVPGGTMDPDQALNLYARSPQAGEHPHWVYGNVPPGYPGDVRPGFWQGNTHGPRSYGHRNVGFIIYRIPLDDSLPWAHLFCPRLAFDEFLQQKQWIFCRKGDGYAAVWTASQSVWTEAGTWRDLELRFSDATVGLLVAVGGKSTDGSFPRFCDRADSLRPQWDAAIATISASLPDGPIDVGFESGPRRNGQQLSTRFGRIECPFGQIPMGARELLIDVRGDRCEIDLNFAGE
jgi:hypothetical protein